MTTADALLRAILLAPDDDGARLVYADWLMENDQGLRGEFVKVQVELALWPDGEHCPRCGGHWKFRVGTEGLSECNSGHRWTADAHRTLRSRERELLQLHTRCAHGFKAKGGKHLTLADCQRCQSHRRNKEGAGNPTKPLGGLWLGRPFLDDSLPGWAQQWNWTWRRGFVAEVALPERDFVGLAGRLFAQPIEKVTLTDKRPVKTDGQEVYTWACHHARDNEECWQLPWELFDLLLPDPRCVRSLDYNTLAHSIRDYNSEADALHGLSALACVRFGRKAAGLDHEKGGRP